MKHDKRIDKSDIIKGKRKVFWINVRGIRYDNSDGTSRIKYLLSLKDTDKIILIREPENAYDNYAVKVVYRENFQIGYVEREYSKLISTYLESGYDYDVKHFLIERSDIGYRLYCGISVEFKNII